MLAKDSSWDSRSGACWGLSDSIEAARDPDRGRANKDLRVDTGPEDIDLATVACERREEMDDAYVRSGDTGL